MQISTVGLDLAKRIFQVHAVDASGDVVVRKALRRSQVLPFFTELPPCLNRHGGVRHIAGCAISCRSHQRSEWRVARAKRLYQRLPPTNSRSSSSLLLARAKSARAIGLIHEIERGIAAADAANSSTTGMSRPGSAGLVPSDS